MIILTFSALLSFNGCVWETISFSSPNKLPAYWWPTSVYFIPWLCFSHTALTIHTSGCVFHTLHWPSTHRLRRSPYEKVGSKEQSSHQLSKPILWRVFVEKNINMGISTWLRVRWGNKKRIIQGNSIIRTLSGKRKYQVELYTLNFSLPLYFLPFTVYFLPFTIYATLVHTNDTIGAPDPTQHFEWTHIFFRCISMTYNILNIFHLFHIPIPMWYFLYLHHDLTYNNNNKFKYLTYNNNNKF